MDSDNRPIKYARTSNPPRAAPASKVDPLRAAYDATAASTPQHATVDATGTEDAVINIDKAVFAILIIDVSDDEQSSVKSKLRAWETEGRLERGSTKGKGFRECFLKILKDGPVIEINVGQKSRHSLQFMNVMFNPSRLDARHYRWLGGLFKRLYPLRYREIIGQLRLSRIDVCVDLSVDVNSLVVRLRKSMVESKFFVLTDKDGRFQTIYLGSVQSALHACIYDQVESDKYKAAVGEKTSSPYIPRAKAADDAEVIIKRTRFEVRRIFADLPFVDTLTNWTAPFDRIDVWSVPNTRALKNDPEFWMYLDTVKWRGVAGASKFLKAHGCKDIERYEGKLTKHMLDWWKPQEFGKRVSATILGSELWKFLKQ